MTLFRSAVALFIFGLLAARGEAQVKGARFIRVADSSVVQTVHLADGSTLVGRFVSVAADPLRFETQGGVVSIMRSSIREVRETPRRALRNGQVWSEDPNPSRLFFGPTARSLPRGEADFSDTYLFFLNSSVGLPGNAQIGAGLSVFPFDNFKDNLFFVNGKIGIAAGSNVRLAVGGLIGWAGGFGDDIGGESAGALYAVGTFGSRDHALTLGLGAPIGSGIDSEPVFLAGGETRVGRRVKLVTENYFAGNHGGIAGIFGYGIRIFGEKLAVDLAFLNSTDGGVFPGVPYVDVVIRF